jgi:hypothetical protein
MVLRGGSEQFIDEAERSLHDAIMIVRRALKNASVVAGGGAIDMEISRCRTELLAPAGPPPSDPCPDRFRQICALSYANINYALTELSWQAIKAGSFRGLQCQHMAAWIFLALCA